MILPTTFVSGAKHYLAGVLAAAFNGGISGVAGIFGIDTLAIAGVQAIHVLNWHEMGAAFLGGFVLHGIFWLKAHPLPESYDTAAPFIAIPKTPPSSPADPPVTQP